MPRKDGFIGIISSSPGNVQCNTYEFESKIYIQSFISLIKLSFGDIYSGAKYYEIWRTPYSKNPNTGISWDHQSFFSEFDSAGKRKVNPFWEPLVTISKENSRGDFNSIIYNDTDFQEDGTIKPTETIFSNDYKTTCLYAIVAIDSEGHRGYPYISKEIEIKKNTLFDFRISISPSSIIVTTDSNGNNSNPINAEIMVTPNMNISNYTIYIVEKANCNFYIDSNIVRVFDFSSTSGYITIGAKSLDNKFLDSKTFSYSKLISNIDDVPPINTQANFLESLL